MRDFEDGEAAVELAYQFNAYSGIDLLFDYQYLVKPGLEKMRGDAQAAGVRIKLTF